MPENSFFNAAVSLTLLLIGLLIHFFFRPKVFAEHAFVRYAFQLWVLRWWISSSEWVFISNLSSYKAFRFFSLAFIDLDNIVALAFCLTFLIAKELRAKWWSLLGLGLAFLLIWNLRFINSSQALSSGWLPEPFWTMASFLVSTSISGLIMFAFFFRYRWFGLFAILSELFQSVLQAPGYRAVFEPNVVTSSGMRSLEWLAWGKLIEGLFFYTILFLREESINLRPIHIPKMPKFKKNGGGPSSQASPADGLRSDNPFGLRYLLFAICASFAANQLDKIPWVSEHAFLAFIVAIVLCLSVFLYVVARHYWPHH